MRSKKILNCNNSIGTPIALTSESGVYVANKIEECRQKLLNIFKPYGYPEVGSHFYDYCCHNYGDPINPEDYNILDWRTGKPRAKSYRNFIYFCINLPRNNEGWRYSYVFICIEPGDNRISYDGSSKQLAKEFKWDLALPIIYDLMDDILSYIIS